MRRRGTAARSGDRYGGYADGVATVNDPERRAGQSVWFRLDAPLPGPDLLHRGALAYASDLTLLAVSTLPHPDAFGSPKLQMATIDHSMWFHRPIRADQWVLYDQSSPNAANALGLSYGRLYSADGVLGANAVQEGLIRMADERERRGLV